MFLAHSLTPSQPSSHSSLALSPRLGRYSRLLLPQKLHDKVLSSRCEVLCGGRESMAILHSCQMYGIAVNSLTAPLTPIAHRPANSKIVNLRKLHCNVIKNVRSRGPRNYHHLAAVRLLFGPARICCARSFHHTHSKRNVF